jgi:hypothetical protein
MDEKFASHSADARVGETVRLVASDVIAFAESCQRIAIVLNDWLADPKNGAAMVGPAKSASLASPMPSKPEADLGLGLSAVAQKVAMWIAKNSESGQTDFADANALAAAFATESEQLEDVLAELEAEGLVTTVFRGREMPAVKPTVDLYASLDPHAVGSDPLSDVVELTKRILEGEDHIATDELHASTGWTLRRFNPALSLVLARIDDQRISKEMCPEYPARHFFLLPVDKAELKRFLKQAGG